MKSEFRICFVCLGNIVRSPLAENLFLHIAGEAGVADQYEVDSAGIGAWHIGESPDPRSIQTAKIHGIDISRLRARQFTRKDFENFDLILAMDSSNYQDIVRHSGDETERAKVKLIMNYKSPGFNQSVPDPYYDDEGFEIAYHMLDDACDKLIEAEKQELP